jgi:hypothetical protein
MSYHDFKSEWDAQPFLLEKLPLYALRAWRDVMREPVWDAVCNGANRDEFDAVMDICDTGRSHRVFGRWWQDACADLEAGHNGGVYTDRLKQLQRYLSVVHAIARVEAREVAELLAGRAA